MNSFRSGLVLIAGLMLLAASLIAGSLSVNSQLVSNLLLLTGLLLSGFALFSLRDDISQLFRESRRELLLTTVGLIGVLVAIAWITALHPLRMDLTANREYSLSPQTVKMMQAIDKPVHITFFHDRGMRETVELYELFAAQNDKITVEFFDPMVNPAQAKLRGVEFAGTALYESEGRKLTINGPTETDIANGILRITQAKQQVACFLDGHGEPDPFSLESHDHMEGDTGHSHGLETKFVQHERHGMAKARGGLEAMNYVVEKVSLLKSDTEISHCAVLIVAGPQSPLLDAELRSIDRYLDEGGNAMFMIDPFVKSGLEPIIRKFGIDLGQGMVIDEASHFWADPSTPAVTDYNRHEITSKLPLSFFPGVRPLIPTKEPVPGVQVRQLVNSSAKSFANADKARVDYKSAKNGYGPQTLMVTARINPKTVESGETLLKRLRGEETADGKAAPEKPIARKEARIVVLGDSDFATNSFYHVLGNGALFLNAVNFLASRENLIGLEPRTFDLPLVSMTNTQMKGTFILSIILIPLLMAAVGVAVWWRRR
ncbi:MAG: hypothetical protein RI928_1762 [Pseudomonadota bacterium]|jgi:ABC-type uncharacterized transport system involved in gliding motility auxiliary subunit